MLTLLAVKYGLGIPMDLSGRLYSSYATLAKVGVIVPFGNATTERALDRTYSHWISYGQHLCRLSKFRSCSSTSATSVTYGTSGSLPTSSGSS